MDITMSRAQAYRQQLRDRTDHGMASRRPLLPAPTPPMRILSATCGSVSIKKQEMENMPQASPPTCSNKVRLAQVHATDRAMASMLLVGKGDLNFDDARQAGRSLLERTDTVLEGKRVRQ